MSLTLASGAAMDRPAPPARLRRGLQLTAAALLAGLLGLVLWRGWPQGYPLKLAELDIATVQAGTFHDELVSRASAVPLNSIVIDTLEDGRVDAVLVKDGAMLARGQLMFRLSSSQRAQELMARTAEVAQQLANLSSLRAQWAASRATQRRELSLLDFEEARADKAHRRNLELGQTGFLSVAALEESADRLAQQQRLLEQARADGEDELGTREQSVREMERAVAGMNQRLQAQREAADAMAVRAPADGRLTGFALQVGETVRPGTRIGRIDSAGRFKLNTRVDEFYLDRIAPGLAASIDHGGRRHALTVTRIDPQVKDGRFSLELTFDDASAAPTGLQAGQTLDTRITLGQPGPALLLADGAFYADSGGAWVFALARDSHSAERRAVKLGRRAAGFIEVLGGLQPGERVIVSSYLPYLTAQQLRLQP